MSTIARRRSGSAVVGSRQASGGASAHDPPSIVADEARIVVSFGP